MQEWMDWYCRDLLSGSGVGVDEDEDGEWNGMIVNTANSLHKMGE
jgi:hypothetical protein